MEVNGLTGVDPAINTIYLKGTIQPCHSMVMRNATGYAAKAKLMAVSEAWNSFAKSGMLGVMML